MNYFDRNIEMMNGFETDFLRLIYYDIPGRFRDNYRSYEYHRICSIIEGRKHVRINTGKSFSYDRNEFLLLPPESTVEMEIDVPTRALVLELSDHLIDHIRKRVCSEWEISDDFLDGSLIYRDSVATIDQEFREITSLATGNARDKEFLVDLHAQRMVYTLLTGMGAKAILLHSRDNPIVKAIALMHAQCGSSISLAEIAYAVNMSSALFSMNFKRITGTNPLQYFTAIKLEKARELLRHESVTDVAFDLGYDNISHFIKLFRGRFGITPKQYQLKYYTSVN